MKILAVDDNPTAQLALAGTLKAMGHDVTVASDGESAWAALGAATDIRVVACDWRLPGMDGLDLCRRVRNLREDYVSFILVTQEPPSDEHLREAYAAGVDAFLTKPVNELRLQNCLHVAGRILEFTSEIRHLQALLPICSYCKKIRDDHNYWQRIDTYLADRVGARFSHSICPQCYEHKVVPQINQL